MAMFISNRWRSIVSIFTLLSFGGIGWALAAGEPLSLPEPSGPPPTQCQTISGQTVAPKIVTLKQTFFDNFNHLDWSALSSRTGRGWRGYFSFNDPSEKNAHTLAANHEQQLYVYPAYRGSAVAPLGLNPFEFQRDALNIVASRTPDAVKASLYDFPYVSGLLQSRDLFSQMHGYFEVKAKFPHGHSMWPAFWLLNTNLAWPPEIDVFEAMDGDHPDHITVTTHWKKDGKGEHLLSYCHLTVADADNAFHLYGVLWNPDRITYYLDRNPVATLATPPGLDRPMFMLLNLAVENNITANTPATARFGIAYVAAYGY